MRIRQVASQAAELRGVSSEAARLYGTGRLWTARRARRLRRRAGWEYRETLKEGLLDPALTDATLRGLVSRYARREAQTRLNPLALEPLTEQKLIFHRYCDAIGIPVPELYGAVGRVGGWSARPGRALTGRDAFAAFVHDHLPEEFVVKPADGHHGLGVRLLSRAGGRLEQVGRGPVDPRILHDELVADPEFDLFVVQQRLHNHEAVSALCHSPVLQTLRLTTLVRRDGGVTMMHAILKLALGTASSDNYHSGLTGNGLADVDLANGRLGPLLTPGPGGYGARPSRFIPGTDRVVEGWPVPHWDEACDLVRRGAPLFLPLRTLGWDVALTPDGPVVVETNNYWGAPFAPMDPGARALLLEP